MKSLKDSILSLAEIPENELLDILSYFNELQIKKKKIVEFSGQVCKHLYYIESGMARLYYEKDGKDITGWFSTEGDFITANDSFFQKKNSLLNLEIFDNSKVFMISIQDLEYLFLKYHKFETFGRLLTYKLLNTLSERMYAMLFQSAEKRYQLLSVYYPEVLMRAPLGDIATFLGISQETLSRIRSQKATKKTLLSK